MKTALLSLALALACLPNLWGQPVGKETIVYRLTDGFPPYQIEAQEVDSKSRYKRYYEVNRIDVASYALTEWVTTQNAVVYKIHQAEEGKYQIENPNGQLYPVDNSWYYWDENGCLVHFALDPVGRAMWFRYCPER